MVGGADYAESQFNRAVTRAASRARPSSPSSTWRRWKRAARPTRSRDDAPINIDGWTPGRLRQQVCGPMTLAHGAGLFAQHGGGAACLEVGPERRSSRSRSAWASPRNLQAEPSIALGTAGSVAARADRRPMRPSPMAAMASSPIVITRIETADGKVLYERRAGRRRARWSIADHGRRDERHAVDALDIGTGKHAHLPAGRRPARPAPARMRATPGSSASPAAW